MPRIPGLEQLKKVGFNDWSIETIDRMKHGLETRKGMWVWDISLGTFTDDDSLKFVEFGFSRTIPFHRVIQVALLAEIQHLEEGTIFSFPHPGFGLSGERCRSILDAHPTLHKAHSIYLSIKSADIQRQLDEMKKVVAELVEQMKNLKPEITM